MSFSLREKEIIRTTSENYRVTDNEAAIYAIYAIHA